MKHPRTQILFIHGGTTFKNKKEYLQYLRTRKISLDKKVRWSDAYLDKNLGDAFEIIRPNMPLKECAQYAEWKIHFERYLPHLQERSILIGASLGGIFLAKYLSEHRFPKKLLSVYLVCPPFDDTAIGEDLAGGFKLPSNLSRLEENAPKLSLLFSKDDPSVPLSHAQKYAQKLKHSRVIVYANKNGHFKVSEFPEIVRMIREDVQKLRP